MYVSCNIYIIPGSCSNLIGWLPNRGTFICKFNVYYIMETIRLGDIEIGYSVGDNSLFIEIIETKLSIWIPKQDALNITKKK